MRSWPMWCRITGATKGNADFGSRDGFSQEVLVGTGPQNTHSFGTLSVTVDHTAVGRVFTMFIDGIPVKRCRVEDKQFTPMEVPS